MQVHQLPEDVRPHVRLLRRHVDRHEAVYLPHVDTLQAS